MARQNFLVVTPEFQFLFPNIFEPKPFMRNGKPQGEPFFGTTMLFDPAVIQPLKDKAIEAARSKWPDRPLSELKFPFSDGNKAAEKATANKKDGEFYKGKIVLKARSKFQPQAYKHSDLQHALSPLEGKNLIYSGAYGYAELNFQPYDAIKEGDKDGVSVYVNFVMVSAKQGKRIAGRDAASVFAGIQGGQSAHNPDLDDDIPF